MSIPSFKTNSKPTISQEEFNSNKKESGGKFFNDPGTFDMVIKEITFKSEPNAKDGAWVGSTILLESEGKQMKYFLDVPTECRNGFLFGAEKAVWPLEKLQKFFRALGLVFDYENGMSQVAALFGDSNKLVGKSIKVRLGYNTHHAKYVAKDEYVLVEKDHTTKKLEGTYANKDALNAAAAEAGIKRDKNQDFIQVLELFAAKEAVVDLDAPTATVDIDLPF